MKEIIALEREALAIELFDAKCIIVKKIKENLSPVEPSGNKSGKLRLFPEDILRIGRYLGIDNANWDFIERAQSSGDWDEPMWLSFYIEPERYWCKKVYVEVETERILNIKMVQEDNTTWCMKYQGGYMIHWDNEN